MVVHAGTEVRRSRIRDGRMDASVDQLIGGVSDWTTGKYESQAVRRLCGALSCQLSGGSSSMAGVAANASGSGRAGPLPSVVEFCLVARGEVFPACRFAAGNGFEVIERVVGAGDLARCVVVVIVVRALHVGIVGACSQHLLKEFGRGPRLVPKPLLSRR